MNMNATLLGQAMLVFALGMAALGYYLGKRKNRMPLIMAILFFFAALLPPISVIFAFLLARQPDIADLTATDSAS